MDQHYSTSFTVSLSPEEAFAAINNVKGWWSEQIEGDTDKLGAEFNYHYKDVHRASFKITEFVPAQKVVWHVVDNYFNFIQDQSEWIGTDIVFEIKKKGDQTEVHFTHIGLVPAYECYEVCSSAWGSYVTHSLHNLITTGQGQPNPIEEVVNQAQRMSQQAYTTAFTVDQSPEEVFAAINDVRGWWSEDFEGATDKLNAEFMVRFGDIHRSTQQITEFIPAKKIVWSVLDSHLNFLEDKNEWTGTDIVFEIARKNGRTELTFTHLGLVPAIECYSACSDAWSGYINHSLFTLISQGKGEPTPKDKATEAELAE